MRACLSRCVYTLYVFPINVILMMSQKLNEHCFERCVPKPGTSLSKGEENCFTACMEKYMGAWNTVSKQYVGRIQKEQQSGAVQNL
jgi:import inner membrane translocase subunit TIM13